MDPDFSMMLPLFFSSTNYYFSYWASKGVNRYQSCLICIFCTSCDNLCAEFIINLTRTFEENPQICQKWNFPPLLFPYSESRQAHLYSLVKEQAKLSRLTCPYLSCKSFSLTAKSSHRGEDYNGVVYRRIIRQDEVLYLLVLLSSVYNSSILRMASKSQEKGKGNVIDSCQALQHDETNQIGQNENKDKENKGSQGERGIVDMVKDFFRLYDLCDSGEKALVILGMIVGLISGTAFSVFVFFWGKEIDHIFNDLLTISQSLDKSRDYFLAFIGIGLAAWLLDTILFAIWRVVSQSLSHKFRKNYLEAFVERKIEWIETQNLYEVSSTFKEHCRTIENAIGDKVGLFFNFIGLTISGVIFSLAVRWTLSLFLMALVPFGGFVIVFFLYVLIKKRQATVEFYQAANSQATEATSLIKTVKLLGAEEFQQKTYKQHLLEFAKKIESFPAKLGITTGLFYFILYITHAASFLLASQCMRGTSVCPVSTTGAHYTIGDAHIVFAQLFLAVYSYIQLSVNLEAIYNAIESSRYIYQFIEDTKTMNIGKVQGLSKEELSIRIKEIGAVQLKNVHFAYPSKPDNVIFESLTIKLMKNKFNAIVGATGAGKSTIIQLILKNYEINKGSITIDGVDIKDIDAGWLRERIGYVSQEPTIFCGSIRENVRVGNPNATDEEIYEALKKAKLEDFVRQLPGGLDYEIGAGGSKMSGGQKQRIAIARALVKKPVLLIFDEATSALDRNNQKAIQKTINQIVKLGEITVLCIAHRIKTIKHADKIWYIQNGAIKEQGKLSQLYYFKDVVIQQDEQQLEFQNFYVKKNSQAQQSAQINAYQAEQQINIYSRLYQYTNNKCSFIIGIIFSFINSFNNPAASVFVAYVYHNLVTMYTWGERTAWTDTKSFEGYYDDAIKILIGYVGFSIYSFIPNFVQFYVMAKIEDQIIHNLRIDVFNKLMLMPNEWYERPENEGGQAASRLGNDAQQMGGLITKYIPNLICNFSSILIGLAISIGFSWKLGLVDIYALPALALSGFILISFIGGFDDDNMSLYTTPDKISDQLIINIKTVLSLSYQKRLLNKYAEKLFQPTGGMAKRGALVGVFFGFSLFILFTALGVSLYGAAHIIANDGNIDFKGVAIAMVTCVWCGWMTGNNFMFIARSGAGKKSAKAVFTFLDAKTEAENQARQSGKADKAPEKIKGRIELKNVSFRYNNDPSSKKVIDNVSLVIGAGQKAAFVGESGCGKTTLLQLLQRAYKYEGEILLDGVNILDYDLKKYRSYLSVLNQEPSVFSGTIGSNLAFNQQPSEKEIYEACENSSCYDISLHKQGEVRLQDNIKEYLKRDVGPKGSKLSGGEKQRLACARAMIRNPQIFLMDEGTSALDRMTEKKVQDSIDHKFKSITTVTIAHRIETIEDSDVIFMFDEGKLVEQGSYKEMMKKKSHFQKFVKGSKYKTIEQITELAIHKLICSLFGIE